MIDGGASAQAAVMSFADTFWMVAIVFVVSAPLVLLLSKGNRKVAVGGGH